MNEWINVEVMWLLVFSGRHKLGCALVNVRLTPCEESHSIFLLTKLIDKTQSKSEFSPVGDMSNRLPCVTFSHFRVQVEATFRSAPFNADWGLISFCKSVHHYNVKSLNPGWESVSHVNSEFLTCLLLTVSQTVILK